MSHLDDGTLQAWLDGPRSGLSAEELAEIAEQIERSPELAARVAELRASTEGTQSLLNTAGAAAGAGAPSFADLVERRRVMDAEGGAAAEGGVAEGAETEGGQADGGQAEGGSPQAPTTSPHPQARRWNATRWAASIAIAIGAGWVANDLYRTPAARGIAEMSLEAEALPLEAEPLPPEIEAPAASPQAEAVDESAFAPLPSGVGPGPDDALRSQERSGESGAAPPPTPAVVAAAEAPPSDPNDPVGDVASNAGSDVVSAPARRLSAAELDEVRQAGRSAGFVVPAVAGTEAERAGEATPFVIRGRVIDATNDQPLPGVQVYVEGTDWGALTNATGDYFIALDSSAARARALRTDSLAVVASRIGYGEQQRALTGALENVRRLDFQLETAAMALNAIVVTGAADEPERLPSTVGPDVVVDEVDVSVIWFTLPLDEVEQRVGFPALVVPLMDFESAATLERDGRTFVRVIQPLDGGGRLTLFQTREPVSLDDFERLRGVVPNPVPDDETAVTTQVGDIFVWASAPRPTAYLQELLERLR